MKSLDNLRKWADGLRCIWLDPNDHSIIVTTCDDMPPSMDCVSLRDHINGILDGIEREVKTLTDERDLLKTQWEAGVDFDQRLEACADKREDVTLWGVDYTPLELVKEHLDNRCMTLPLDADGVPIHVGDVMEWRYGNGEFEVIGIGGNTLFYIDKDSNECEWTAAGDKRHHHAQTVEDVLREFAERYLDYEGVPSAGRRGIGEALMDEYAARLMLAGDAE